MKTIKLGKVENLQAFAEIRKYIGTITIERETGKAVQVKFQGVREDWDYETIEYRADKNDILKITNFIEIYDDDYIVSKWLPKSQITIYEDRIEVADSIGFGGRSEECFLTDETIISAKKKEGVNHDKA